MCNKLNKNTEIKYKKCKSCREIFPETRDYFGNYKNVRNGQIIIGFRNKCRKCMAKHTAEYDKKNPKNAKARAMRRKKLINAASGIISNSDLKKIRNTLSDSCRYCNEPLNGKGDIEHLTPISRGGSNNLNNITLSCSKCNLAKTKKTHNEFIIWRDERNLVNRNINIPFEKPDNPTLSKKRCVYL